MGKKIKKSKKVTVVFLQEYANKKAGDESAFDSMLAGSLVSRGVAQIKRLEGTTVKTVTEAPKADQPMPESKPQSSQKKNKK